MKIYEIREVMHRGHNGTKHVAYVGGINKTVDFILSCCNGKIISGWYEKNGSEKSVNKYKEEKDEKGLSHLVNLPLTKTLIKKTIQNNKESSFAGRGCGGYYFNVYDVIEITVE